MAYCHKYGVRRCTSTALPGLLLPNGGLLGGNVSARRGASCLRRCSHRASCSVKVCRASCRLPLPDVRRNGPNGNEVQHEAGDEMLLPYRRHAFCVLHVSVPASASNDSHSRRSGLVPGGRAAGLPQRHPAVLVRPPLPCLLLMPRHACPRSAAPPAAPSVIAPLLFPMQSQEKFYATQTCQRLDQSLYPD